MSERGFMTRELAAKVIFTMLYAGAVEGSEIWIGPKQVYRMSDEQARRTADDVRRDYGVGGWKPRFPHTGRPWYADTSREPIRDETLRAFARGGAVLELPNVPTASSKPRYALSRDFMELFNPAIAGNDLDEMIGKWQKAHLSPHALARLELVRRRVVAGAGGVEVTLPNGGVRPLALGPSALLTKAAV